MYQPIALYTTPDIFIEAFDEYAHSFVVVEDVIAHERTFGLLICVHLDNKSMLGEAMYEISALLTTFIVPHVLRRQ